MSGYEPLVITLAVLAVLAAIGFAVVRPNVIHAFESFVYFVGSQASLGDSALACSWRAPIATEEEEPPKIMHLTNGDLVSFVEILGVCKYLGQPEFEQLAYNLGEILSSKMKTGNGRNHSFQFSFRSDSAGSARVAEDLMAPLIYTARRLGVKDVTFFEARRSKIATVSTDESVYLAVFTHRAGMSKNETRIAGERSMKERADLARRKQRVSYDDMFSQSLQPPPTMLVQRHEAAVKNLLDSLRGELHEGGAFLLTNLMDIGEAANVVRRVYDHSNFPASWQPRFFGSKGFSPASAIARPGDEAARMPVALGRQMITESMHEKFGNIEYSQMGRWLSATLKIDVLPEFGSEPFNDLMTKLGRKVPLAYMIEVLPKGFNFRKQDQFFGSFMAATSDDNKDLKRGWDELKLLEREKHYIGATRIIMSTWAPNEADLQANMEYLRNSVDSWGSAVSSNETGEPALATLATAAGYARGSPANYLVAPVSAIARMAPVVRAASIWKHGHLVCTTLEGRPYPIAMGTKEQTSWASVGFAPPGSGKSFFMNLLNSGLLMAPGAQEVPYVTVIDVGPSSKLIMDWYRAMLPPEKRHQVASIRVQNTPEFGINPWDTPLGFDKPPESCVDYQIAVLGTIAPGLGDEKDKFFRKLIMATYERFSRSSVDAKVWQRALDPEVNAAMERHGVPFEESVTRVWDVVDALFAAGNPAMAERAQIYAMPILKDFAKVVQQPEITIAYGDAVVNGEKLVKIFQRNLSDAMTGAYMLISGYTRANLGAARAVSIDLEEVVGTTTSEEGVRRSALMFLFGRHLGARHFFSRWDDMAGICPPAYRAYQKDRVTKMWEQMKFLEYDEIHYASEAKAFKRLLDQDLRVGRKFGTNVMMMSQNVTDFPDELMNNVANFFIFTLGDADGKMAKKIQDTFSLSRSEMDAIRKHCTAPGALFARFVTTKGTLSQVLKTTASPLDLWAFTTTAADAPIRALLAEKLGGGDDGYRRSVTMLAKLLPNGSAKPMIERIKASMSADDQDDASMAGRVCELLLERAAQREEVEA